MPTYVYECKRCGEFEEQQSITAPSLSRCPTCGGEVRLIIAENDFTSLIFHSSELLVAQPPVQALISGLESYELSRANGRKISRMAEQDEPFAL